jgi:26S proteasome non-ATPase regulatory subunit 9
LLFFLNPKKKPGEEQDKIASELHLRMTPKPKPKFDPITQKWVVKNWDGTVSGIENGHTRSFDRLDECHNRVVPNSTDVVQEATDTAVPTVASAPTIATRTSVDVPFAVVDEVAPDSPAEDCGLRPGDLIVHFGPVNYYNHRNLSAIAEIVPDAAAKGRELTVVVLRRRRMSVDHDVPHSVETGIRIKKEIKLSPRTWSGRGLLGCHIKAYADATDYEEP